MNTEIISGQQIDQSILVIRGKRVMLDADLAELYGIETFRLNEQVKRNPERFPMDFMFRLTKEEKDFVIKNVPHLNRLKFSRTTPLAFTEHGALMLASVLNTETAINVSIEVVRGFVKFRELMTTHRELAIKLVELESKYDEQFAAVFAALHELMNPDFPSRQLIGFNRESLL